MKSYRVSQTTASPDREEARSRVATGILRGMSLRDMKLAIERADRKTVDKAGRQLKIGANVAQIVCQLFYRDGQGEAGDGSIHQAGFAWEHVEGSLTSSKLRTGKRVGQEEGLFECWVGQRPGDRQNVCFYRLNLWEVARVVAKSELENVSTLLETEGRPAERERLEARQKELRGTLKDLDLIDLGAERGPDGGPGGHETEGEDVGRVLTKSQDRYVKLTELHNTSSEQQERVLTSSTPKKAATAASSLPVNSQKTKKLGTLTDEEAAERWDALVANDPHGGYLRMLAAIMAEANATEKVSVRRVWRSLGLRYSAAREKTRMSEAAWAFGFEKAIDADAPNIGYVMRAAQNYRPDNEARRRSGKSLRPKGGLGLDYDE